MVVVLSLHFAELAQFETTRDLQSSDLYQRLEPEIRRILTTVLTDSFESRKSRPSSPFIKAVAWNIERGLDTPGVIRALESNPQLQDADVLMLSEVDLGMARTQNRFVVRDIAESLGLHFAFAPCYIALNKGSGVEKRAVGENRESLHGNALLSRYPMDGVHSLALPNGKE
jgi:endonuclease/exonuclease/phosphatase family metal-dependent hydrolase